MKKYSLTPKRSSQLQNTKPSIKAFMDMGVFVIPVFTLCFFVAFTFFFSLLFPIAPETTASTTSTLHEGRPEAVNVSKARSYKLPDDDESDYELYGVFNEYTEGADQLTSWNSKKLVVIDPGHGGSDPGANINGILEKDICLDVSLRLASLLRHEGISTYVTRKKDTAIKPKDRILLANAKNAALFLSVHCNWFWDTSKKGVTTLYYPDNTLNNGGLSESGYASILQNEMLRTLGANDMGICERSDLAVLRHAVMPSIIVELGFLSNEQDVKLLASEDYRQDAANALADGIQKSLAEIGTK